MGGDGCCTGVGRKTRDGDPHGGITGYDGRRGRGWWGRGWVVGGGGEERRGGETHGGASGDRGGGGGGFGGGGGGGMMARDFMNNSSLDVGRSLAKDRASRRYWSHEMIGRPTRGTAG